MTNADQAASPVYTPAVHRPAVVFDARASSEKDATVDDNKKRREQKKKEKKKREREEKRKAAAAAKYGPPRPPAPPPPDTYYDAPTPDLMMRAQLPRRWHLVRGQMPPPRLVLRLWRRGLCRRHGWRGLVRRSSPLSHLALQ